MLHPEPIARKALLREGLDEGPVDVWRRPTEGLRELSRERGAVVELVGDPPPRRRKGEDGTREAIGELRRDAPRAHRRLERLPRERDAAWARVLVRGAQARLQRDLGPDR